MKAHIKYESMVPGLQEAQLADIMAGDDEGQVLWNKRNRIWTYRWNNGAKWAVKRFSSHFPAPVIYSCRSSKACRSFRYAVEMTRRGIGTPAPVAYAERRGPFGLLLDSIYISVYADSISLEEALEAPGDRHALLAGLADFMARFHNAGFIHRDANRTNIRISRDSGEFLLIDLNRMKVYPDGSVPTIEERFDDVCNWSGLDDDFREFAYLYAGASGLDSTQAVRLLEWKERFDRRSERRRRRNHPIRTLRVCLNLNRIKH